MLESGSSHEFGKRHEILRQAGLQDCCLRYLSVKHGASCASILPYGGRHVGEEDGSSDAAGVG